MMGMVNAFILVLAVLSPYIQGIKAECRLDFSIPRPQIVTHFGSKHLVTETTESLQRESGELIDLYCPNGFIIETNNYARKNFKNHHMEFTCDSDLYWYCNGNRMYINSLQCSSTANSEVYESRASMPNCANFMSLVVGQKFGDLGTLKSVAMCYDIIEQQLKYASYTAYPSKIKVIEKTQVGQLNELGLDIEVAITKSLFRPVSADTISAQFKKDKYLKALFGDETYEYAILVQDESFANDLMGLKEMLGIVWLRALRTGNWRHLLNALQIASLNAKYDVNVGVSGTVTIPTLQACNETRSLYIELDSGDSVPVPAHIWAHIRALEPTLNGTDEFVVVAHNSPFFTSNERDGLCKSMCEEVSWLKNSLFAKLQHYPVYGLVQCCRVSDVENKLDNFPNYPKLIQFVEPPQYSELPTASTSGSTTETTLGDYEELQNL